MEQMRPTTIGLVCQDQHKKTSLGYFDGTSIAHSHQTVPGLETNMDSWGQALLLPKKKSRSGGGGNISEDY